MTLPSQPRVRAPELRGAGGWINTGGRDVRLRDLRGKIALLDFWTFCCINCLHVLEELRPLEERYADVLVVLGVHSPKFQHEGDHDAVVAAVERYGVGHPVLDDPGLGMWNQYAVRAWPTLVLIDPEGYVVTAAAGEGHGPSLDARIRDLVRQHEAAGTLHRGAGPYVPPPDPDTELRYPAKVAILPDASYLVSDTGHDSLVQLDSDARTVLRRIGSGRRGAADGPPGDAEFAEPQGLAVLPPDLAHRAGYDVVVADTVNGSLRGVDLGDGTVSTVATGLSSPWDVAVDPAAGEVVVAMAGEHTLWRFDPGAGTARRWAGTRNEGLVDGAAPEAWFAQPSGLAFDGQRGDDDGVGDGRRGGTLWVADAEISALRRIEHDQVSTAVGAGLFDFGHRDGPAAQALLQHPLGVTVLPGGSVAVLDTYNGAVRRYDPRTRTVSTLAAGLAEPSGAVVVDGDLLVVESAAHRLTRVPLAPVAVPATEYRTPRPATDVRSGQVTLEVVLELPPGQQLDERDGPATRLEVHASPPGLLHAGAGDGPGLRRDLVLTAGHPPGVLHVSARAAACDVGAEHPACSLLVQEWGVPVRVDPGGTDVLTLVLHGPLPVRVPESPYGR